jgi:NADPH-dependent curcumin reductase CurA
MPPISAISRHIVLNARPVGVPIADNFRIEELAGPVPGFGQVLLRTVDLSLDPYMRGRMSDAPSHAAPVAVGAVMVGATISSVEVSEHPAYAVGKLVVHVANA